MTQPTPAPDTRAHLQSLHEALANDDMATVSQELAELHSSEIADLLESLPRSNRAQLWSLILPERAGEVLAQAQDGVREALLEEMEPQEVAAVTRDLASDDVADIIQDLPRSRVEPVLRAMDQQSRQRLTTVLAYPEDSAGGLMSVDAQTVRAEVELDTVISYLRQLGDLPDKTDSLMVVNRDNLYLGLLPLAKLLTGKSDAKVTDLMLREVPSITADMPALEVTRLFEQRDLLSAAVVDSNGLLLGRITVDDVIDVIRDQGDHSLMGLAGLDEDDDMFAPVATCVWRRAVWLGVNLATALLAAWVIGHFEHTIEKLVALAILMPIVASMGGIAGSQILTIMIRGLALGQVLPTNIRSLLYRELAVGAVNGLLWASVVGAVVVWWFGDLSLGLVISAAIVVNLMIAALAGTMLPVLLHKMNIDPALAGGVLLTTITDVIGFIAFLGLATLYLV